MGSLCKLTSQTTTKMSRILLIASFCLLLKQVNATTCCEGSGNDLCMRTCTSSNNKCASQTHNGATVSFCDDGGFCGAMPDGCMTNPSGIKICCCSEDKCNGGNLQYGSVLMTLIIAVISRFI